tara:strand:+ start:2030 stop:2482 length:453 start_codon:yes stop_codon:yes gene_type:complete
MGNRLGGKDHNYRLIENTNNYKKKYRLFYISGGQKYPIPDTLKKFIKGVKVKKDGFVDDYVNKFVICENYYVLFDKFIKKIKPNMYDIFEINSDFWIGDSSKEMLIRSKVINPVNTHIIQRFYSNIIVEDMGIVKDVDLVKKRPNTIFIK